MLEDETMNRYLVEQLVNMLYRENKTEVDLLTENRVILNGEFTLAVDRLKAGLPCFKIGNGKDKYASLPFIYPDKYFKE